MTLTSRQIVIKHILNSAIEKLNIEKLLIYYEPYVTIRNLPQFRYRVHDIFVLDPIYGLIISPEIFASYYMDSLANHVWLPVMPGQLIPSKPNRTSGIDDFIELIKAPKIAYLYSSILHACVESNKVVLDVNNVILKRMNL